MFFKLLVLWRVFITLFMKCSEASTSNFHIKVTNWRWKVRHCSVSFHVWTAAASTGDITAFKGRDITKPVIIIQWLTTDDNLSSCVDAGARWGLLLYHYLLQFVFWILSRLLICDAVVFISPLQALAVGTVYTVLLYLHSQLVLAVLLVNN